jgi:hypothetical protein
MNCNPQEPEMSLSNFIGSISDNQDYSYYDDMNIADVIEIDSAQALIQDYMPKISNINRILSHNDRGETMLHEAIRQGASKIVAFLVGKGAKLNIKNLLGDTPLHLAARFNKTNLAYALLNYGVDINIENIKGEVAINDAVKNGSLEMLRILYNHGGNIFQINKEGDNLLHTTIKYAVNDKSKKTKFLVDKGVNITHKNNKGLTPIDVTEEMAEEMRETKNSNIILEEFGCLTGFKQDEKHYNDDITNILTYLQKVAYQQNKGKFDDYITGELPNSSYVEFDYNVCVGGKLKGQEKTDIECKKEGGSWVNYKPNESTDSDLSDTIKTKVKVEYPEDNEIILSNIKDSDLYRKKCNEPIYVKLLPHMTGELDLSPKTKDTIVKINKKINKPNQNNNNVIDTNPIVEGFNTQSFCSHNIGILLLICLIMLIFLRR